MKEVHIRNLREGDYEKCIDFAIEGLKFHRYFNNEKMTRLYGSYFFMMRFINQV